jgi:hypothetical protein
MSWFIVNQTTFTRHLDQKIDFLPFFRIWYSKYFFLETGVYTPAWGIQFKWINFELLIIIQKGY